MEYKELEASLRAEAAAIAGQEKEWTAAEVSKRLNEIADSLTRIRRARAAGIDASMGKRSGWKVEI